MKKGRWANKEIFRSYHFMSDGPCGQYNHFKRKYKDSKQERIPTMTVLFTCCTALEAMDDECCADQAAHFIDVGSSSSSQACLHISIIEAFCKSVCDAQKSRPDTAIIICPQDDSESSLSNAVLLYGAYLILCQDEPLDRVVDNLRASIKRASTSGARIIDAWDALHRARELHWLAAPDRSDGPVLDIDMAAHYAHPANGGLHMIVPDKLLCFPSPASLPAGQAWADASPGDAGPGRRFSAGFLAELLADLDVTAVVCLGRTGRNDAAAFRRCGLDVHDLNLDRRRPGLLGAMDRLLSLSRAAPGGVAVCGWRGDEAGVGHESVRALGAAWLMAEGGFGSGAAEAWLRMVCGPISELEHSVKE